MTTADLRKQFELSKQLYDAWLKLEPINAELGALSTHLDELKKRAGQTPLAAQIEGLEKKLTELSGSPTHKSLSLLDNLQTLFGNLQEVDAAPTTVVETATLQTVKDANSIIERWEAIEKQDIPELKRQLKQNNLPDLKLTGQKSRSIAVEDADEKEEKSTSAKP